MLVAAGGRRRLAMSGESHLERGCSGKTVALDGSGFWGSWLSGSESRVQDCRIYGSESGISGFRMLKQDAESKSQQKIWSQARS